MSGRMNSVKSVSVIKSLRSIRIIVRSREAPSLGLLVFYVTP